MYFVKESDGFRAWFTIANGGIIRTGAVAGQFTVTIVNPGDTASLVPAVAESATKPGLYSFLITSAFITIHGVGEYGIVVETNIANPPRVIDVFSEVLKVSQEDFDSLGESLIAARTTALAGSTTTVIRTGLAQANDFFNGMQVIVINAAGIAARPIDSYAQINGAITVEALPFTPALNDVVLVISRSGATPHTIADVVWDELYAGHNIENSFSELIQEMSATISALRSLL